MHVDAPPPSRSSYQTAKRVPLGLTERLGIHCALAGSVLLFNWNGALNVTPLSVERM
jgi:hypothetical protein